MAALRFAETMARGLVSQVMRRLGWTLGLWALAFVFGLIGVMGLTIALFIALAEAWGPLMAALIIGFAGLLLSLGLVLTARWRRHLPNLFGPETSDLREALKGHSSEIEVWLPLIAVAFVGLLLGSGKKN